MRKIIEFIIFVGVIFLCLAFNTSAASAKREYTLTQAGEEYILSDGFIELRCGSIDECLEKAGDDFIIRFVDVASEDQISFPKGNYEISGQLNSSGIISISSGSFVSMNNMTLMMEDSAYVRIKGGSLTVTSSEIRGNGSLIKLDYSSTSRLEIDSGVICGNHDKGAIEIYNGSAIICGGDISNIGGPAIKNSSDLILASSPSIRGVGYDIVTDCHISLGLTTGEYYSSSSLEIQYEAEFFEGTLTEIFYQATERSISNIKVFDKNGKEQGLTYFEKCHHNGEKNIAGVYLPHIVKFYVGNRIVAEERLLSGEKVTPFIPSREEGYIFDNWYKDVNLSDPFYSDKKVYSSFSLYASYSLQSPTFCISSMDFMYDEKEHKLKFDSVSHVLPGGYFNYEWYKNGELISTLSELSLREVSDSGIYNCLITYTLNGKSASVYAQNIKININKKNIEYPKISSAKYSGDPLYPSVLESQYYIAEYGSGINVGLYPVTLTLKDPENTKWQDSSESTVTLYFEVTKADNKWIVDPTVADAYVGSGLSPFAMAAFGDVIFLYSATESGSYTRDVPKSAGCYYMKAAVSESADYSGLMSDPVSFNILAEEVIGLKLISNPDRIEYLAFEKLDTQGLAVCAVYNSGREEEIEHQRLIFVYNNSDCLRVGDDQVMIEYLGATVVLSVNVSPLSYDLSSFSFSDSTVVYNGNYQTASLPPYIPQVGLDGIPLICSISGGGVNVGEYRIVASFSSESRDYIIPEDITATLTVLPLEVSLMWEDTEFIYDSTSKVPRASFIDVNGVVRSVKICGAAVYANNGYVASAAAYSDNYIFSNPTVTYDIKKADYDVSSVLWSFAMSTYTGEPIEVVITNLPEGVIVIGYTDNCAINVGKYMATAAFSYDAKNYNPPAINPHEWEITRAEYDMSGVEFMSCEYEYDGLEHFPTQIGEMPIGKDGIELGYTFSRGAINVAEGEVSVVITFHTKSKNYITPDMVISKVKILPKGIYVLWIDDNFVYDGSFHAPTAVCDEAEITVTGYGKNAGEYIATAKSNNPNFRVINSNCNYKIEKAKNYWLEHPTISDFYESQSPNPEAKPYFGLVIFSYYRDEALNNESLPNTSGIYYLVASVPESENFKELVSVPVPFTCMEVKPIGIRCEINGVPVAFSTLEGILSAYLLFNDNSEKVIEYSDLSIYYQNADTLRYKDTECSIFYDEFSAKLEIKVSKAEYDISSVFWNITSVEYDGEYHAPVLCGLPAGVSIISYSSHPVISAGEYEFSVELSYDSDNYFEPHVPVCNFSINKAIVQVINDQTFEYCGRTIYLEKNDLFYPEINSEIINSGSYYVKYVLSDKENYIFDNESYYCYANIIVLPKILYVKVSDFQLYLFERNINPEYTIEGLIEGVDPPEFYYYIDEDKIYVKTDDPNYLLDIEYGKLDQVNYPSESMKRKILIVVFVAVAIMLVVILLVKKRDDISDAILMRKAKSRNKDGLGYVDNSPKIGLPQITENVDHNLLIGKNNNRLISTSDSGEDPSNKSNFINTCQCEETEFCDLSFEREEDDIKSEHIRESNEPSIVIEETYANSMITDDMASCLIKNEREIIYTDGKAKSIINVDTLSRNFIADDRVDVNILKEKSLVPYDTNYIKVLARGAIDKPLHVFANEFSLPAVKMILLSGGEATKVISIEKETNTNH